MADRDLLEPEEGEGEPLEETQPEELEAAEVEAAAEETVEEAPPEEEAEYEPAYAAAPQPKPRSDAYTVMLILAFLLFVLSGVLAYMEIDEFYGPMVWF